ncbi:basement membrane-specific heparan sulfate proteoglycan core protein-like [Xyrauchen texanus]|uniref:basement membrane-specific heparan sulfate proteoglycan core protein-like n=1 Tax=Xyrauchen texanus TaxID=154827 RepID=UPI002241C93E|nr:basement membrane-specific heparan sulfate proteoglycan core protein-like [Xyrauchen texanus]
MDSRYSKCMCIANRQIWSSWSDEVSFTVIDSNEKEFKITAMKSRYSKCKCFAISTSRGITTDWSNEVSFTVIERPKPEVRVNPDHHVFRGETVTLTCDIQTQTHTEWRYSWIKDDSVNPVSTERVYRITSDKSHSGKYSCRGEKIRDSQRSDISDAVTLTVSDSKLNPELTSDTAGAALTGNTVTLICNVTQTAGWDFYWYKHTQNSEKNKTETNSYRVHIDSVSDGGQYWCRAGRGEPVYYTNYSDALWVNVTERQKPEVSVNPDHHVFRGETVTLTCDIQTQTHTEWRYSWIKDDSLNPVSTERLHKIISDKSHSGKYSCRGEKISDSQRSDISDAVTLTVSDKPTPAVIVSPQSSVFTGDTVTLSCKFTHSTGWTIHWNKDSNSESSDAAGTKTIRSVKVSDGGQYRCRAQRGNYSTQFSNTVQVTVEERPKPEVRVNPDHHVFRGETVTLTCDIQTQTHTEWRYSWIKDGTINILNQFTKQECEISRVEFSHQGKYSCRGETRGSRYTHTSDELTLTVSDLPTAKLTVHPETSVFTGETVIMKCDIESDYSNWRYEWYKDRTVVSESERYTVNTNTLTIRGATESDQHQFCCRGKRDGRPATSQNTSVILSVKDSKLNPELTSDTAGAALTGNTVTLICHMTQTARWDFYWYKHTQNSEKNKTETNSYRVHIDSVSDGGQYWCRAGRGEPVYYTNYSDALWVNVTERPKPKVTVYPDHHVFRGETVTLTCDIQKQKKIEWKYSWFKDGTNHSSYSSTQKFMISSVDVSHSGKYSCRGEKIRDLQRSDISDAVTLTVSDKPVLTVNPETSPIFRGETVTLTCDIQETRVTDWTYRFQCDGRDVQNSKKKEFQITASYIRYSKCWCIARRTSTQFNTYWSNEVSFTVIDKPVLTVNPETSPIFRGETVTLTCDLQGTEETDWTYRFQCDGRDVQESNGKEFQFTASYSRYSRTCWCSARRTSTEIWSPWSNVVSFTVIDKPVLTVNPEKSQIFRGETVTLTCDVQGTDWTYGWFCGRDVQNFNKMKYVINNISERNNQKCKCRGIRTSRPFSSDWSDDVTLTVIERPKPEVRVNPDHHVFRGETVTLTCDIETQTHTEWRYSWIKDGHIHYSYPSTQDLKISYVYVSDSGKYSCRGEKIRDSQRSDISDAVTLTVSDKPVLTVNPETSPIFRGETVTLTCDIQGTRVTWTYRFQCDGRDVQNSKKKVFKFTASYIRYSKCWCVARRTSTQFNTDWSNEVSFTVIERPKPEVCVNPDHHVFRGETVTLTCDIQTQTHTEWRYSWIKDDSVNPVSTERVYRITSDKSHSGKYSCRGEKISDSQRSDISDAVTLTVSDSKLNPELTSDTAGAALTGNTVTLICNMTQTAGWDFYWYKHTQNSEKNKTETNSYRVHIDSVSDGGQYWCRAGRGEPVYYTNYSDALWVSVTAQRPSVSLIISPSRSQHFSSHSLSLNCEDHNNSTGWTVRRNTDSERMKDCSSTGSTCEISSLKTSDTGVYWCQSQSGEHSPHINITVHDGDVILESSVHPVIEGDTLTLHCLHRSTNSSILTADFYKDGSLLQNQTTGEMSIPTVSKSHEGFYSCKHGERGQSPESWISVTDLPTAKLTVHPETSVFTGETVIMKCDIESDYSNWRYEWYKDRTVVSESERYTVNTNTLTIRGATESDQHQFCCRGKRDGRPATSQNTSVILSVKDSKLNPELTSDTAGATLTGNTVTLICHMTQTAGWDFYWYKHTQNSEKNKTETNSYRVHIDSVSDGGQYWCRAGRGEPVYYTNYSDALWVSVTAQRPSVSLIISPSRSQHFSSHSLSLNCEDHNNSTGWTVRRNTDSERMKDCSSTGSTCEISSLKTSDTGVYWCESQSGEHSPHINITVHDGDVILESSVHPVIEGDTLTLHCLHRSTNSSILTADFYKDGSLLQNQTTGEMSIPTVSKSHEGFYSCKHGERGQSPESWISVTGEMSADQICVLHTLSSLLAVCPYLMATVVLVFKCYRARVSSVEDQSQFAVTEEETSI